MASWRSLAFRHALSANAHCLVIDYYYRQGARRPDLVNALRDHDASLREPAAFGGEVQAEAKTVCVGGVDNLGHQRVNDHATLRRDWDA